METHVRYRLRLFNLTMRGSKPRCSLSIRWKHMSATSYAYPIMKVVLFFFCKYFRGKEVWGEEVGRASGMYERGSHAHWIIV
jgi:hypothetical protein